MKTYSETTRHFMQHGVSMSDNLLRSYIRHDFLMKLLKLSDAKSLSTKVLKRANFLGNVVV